jgi:hypothetical protein
MKKIGVAAVALTTVVLGGCVSKSQFEEVQGKLTACEAERQQAVTAAASCQENAAKEAERWQGLADSMQKEAPAVLSAIQAEKQVFLQQLPEAVRTQVDSYLEKFAGDVRKAFAVMREQNLKLETKLAEVGDTAGRTEGKADIIIGRIEERERALLADAERVQKGVADLVSTIGEFDRSKINCKDCKDRLVLNRNEREVITAFHQLLVETLSSLRTGGGESAPAAEPSTGGSR